MDTMGLSYCLSYTDASVCASWDPEPRSDTWKVLKTYCGVHAGFPTEKDHGVECRSFPARKLPCTSALVFAPERFVWWESQKLPLVPEVEVTTGETLSGLLLRPGCIVGALSACPGELPCWRFTQNPGPPVLYTGVHQGWGCEVIPEGAARVWFCSLSWPLRLPTWLYVLMLGTAKQTRPLLKVCRKKIRLQCLVVWG